MNVLITGSSGFIGQHLSQKLRDSSWEIFTTCRGKIEPKNKQVLSLDLLDEKFDLTGINTVFHLAGKAHALSEIVQDDEEYAQINTEGTRKLLEAAQNAGVERFIFFSSVKATEDSEFIQNEQNHKTAKSVYGLSKWNAEELVLNGGYVPHPVVIRPAMVYGNTHKGNFPRMIQAINKGYFPPVPEVKNQRSMVHVNDVIQAALLAAENPKAARQIYIVTDSTPYSTRQLYDWIRLALGKPPSSKDIPLSLLNTLGKMGDKIGNIRGKRFLFDSDALEKLLGSAYYSATKIETELGFKAQQHLQDALPEIIQYLQENAHL